MEAQESWSKMWEGDVWSWNLQETFSLRDSRVGCQDLPYFYRTWSKECSLFLSVSDFFSVSAFLCLCLLAEQTLKLNSHYTLPAKNLPTDCESPQTHKALFADR